MIKARLVIASLLAEIDDLRVEDSMASMSQEGSWTEINYTDLTYQYIVVPVTTPDELKEEIEIG